MNIGDSIRSEEVCGSAEGGDGQKSKGRKTRIVHCSPSIVHNRNLNENVVKHLFKLFFTGHA